MKTTVLFLIRFYQRFLSFDTGLLRFVVPGVHGGTCRFSPRCSEYTFQAVEKYGVVNGTRLGLQRITKCHPFNEGGFDPLPVKQRRAR